MSDSEEHFSFDAISSGSESDDFRPEPKNKKAPAKAKPPAKPKATATKAKSSATMNPKPKDVKSDKPKAPAKKKAAPPPASSDNEMNVDLADPDTSDDEREAQMNKGPARDKTASEKYQKLTPLQHILTRPDMYIGSVETVTQPMWTYDMETKRMVHRKLTLVPGFFKIVDEILVNAADNKVNDPSMDTIKVTIDVDNGIISVYNNGRGIPIEIHSKEKIYIPELIFGHLLSGSNYDDTEARLTGGRNGYGAKLANIYSHEFTLETAHKETQQKYKQTWTKNMGVCGKAKITKTSKGEEFTRITFKPDLARFGMSYIDEDTASLLRRRVFDLAGTVKDVKVFLNDERLKIKSFKQYIELYVSSVAANTAESSGGAAPTKPIIIHEVINDRWEVALTTSDGTAEQVSFANSIATTKGGTHVNMIADQIAKGVIAHIEKKNKAAKVKPAQIKNHMWLFVNALIENPTFDNQTKETLTLTVSKFGGRKPTLSEDFHKKVLKSPLIDHVLNWARFKADQEAKKTDGTKRSRLHGIAKLSDANLAGTKHAKDCTLILTEGDSAKALAMAGLGVIGHDHYGVFPLRGKLLNVREARHDQVMKNEEIQAIKRIMGLQHNKDYKDVSSLRYGKIMIMTDQDHDGSHIKGLLINFMDHAYPSLLKQPEFLVEFVTPIVRVSKGTQMKDFFTLPEFEKWLEGTPGSHRWNVKYYKGLGTSSDQDARQYFSRMEKHLIPFAQCQQQDRELIDLAFSKKKADERKEWLRGFRPGTYLDHRLDEIPYSEFINKELILFSMADNIRSIPSVADGLKPGQRKIIWGCFRRKLKKEIKVAQLVGYVAEHGAYHHGETSLMETIIGLAQRFVGSNNLNLLDPSGQYGTRLQGGRDHAAPRYIFTRPTELARLIFHAGDDPLLTPQTEENLIIEPEYYVPILPMVLVNGADGIGTGWSTNVPCYNPSDIIANLRRLMKGEDQAPLVPWWRGFEGEVKEVAKNKYETLGIVKKLDDATVEVTELPVHKWTQTFKEMLEAMIAGGEKTESTVKDYQEHHDNNHVHFIIQMEPKHLRKAEEQGLIDFFKLSTKFSTTNMICFDFEGKIKKYESPEEIIEDFYSVRLTYYQRRKDLLVQELQTAFDKLTNQARFIQMIVDKKLSVSGRKKVDIVAELRKLNFQAFRKVAKAKAAGETEEAAEDGGDSDNDEDDEDAALHDFDYLLGMQIYSLTRERIEKLKKQGLEKEAELEAMLKRSPKDLWTDDLDALEAAWEADLNRWHALRYEDSSGKKVKKKQTKLRTRKSIGKSSKDKDDDDDFQPIKAAFKKQESKPAAKPKAGPSKPKDERATAKKAKSKIGLGSDDDGEDDEPFLKAAPKKTIQSIDISDEEGAASSTRDKAKAGTKRKSIGSDAEATPPKKQKPLPSGKGKATATAGGAARKPSVTKKKPVKTFDLSDSDEEDSSKKGKTTGGTRKASSSKKVVEDSDSDIDMDDLPAPPPRAAAPRAARTARKKVEYVEFSDDEDGKNDSLYADD